MKNEQIDSLKRQPKQSSGSRRVEVGVRCDEFQTPPVVCRYMAKLIPREAKSVLEPTPGNGNLVDAINDNGFNVIAPKNYFQWKQHRVDCVVMNPPFSDKTTVYEGAPEYVKRLTGSAIGYYFIYQAMDLSDNIVALMPWYTLINSKKRVNDFISFGLVSITNLPRSAFSGVRVQTCVMVMQRGFKGQTIFKQFNNI